MLATALRAVGCYLNLLHATKSSPAEEHNPYETGII